MSGEAQDFDTEIVALELRREDLLRELVAVQSQLDRAHSFAIRGTLPKPSLEALAPRKERRRQLTPDEVRGIRTALKDHESHESIAYRYGVTTMTVRHIDTRHTWRDLDPPESPKGPR